MEQFNELSSLMISLEVEMKKFYDKGFDSAGTRARKLLQDIKSKAQEIRIDIQNKKKDETPS